MSNTQENFPHQAAMKYTLKSTKYERLTYRATLRSRKLFIDLGRFGSLVVGALERGF